MDWKLLFYVRYAALREVPEGRMRELQEHLTIAYGVRRFAAAFHSGSKLPHSKGAYRAHPLIRRDRPDVRWYDFCYFGGREYFGA
jgi:hypothetical protein